MPNKSLRVALIDDEPESRQTLRVFLQDYCPEVEILGEADSVLTAYQLLQKIELDAIFLDVQMTDGTGFDLLRKFPEPAFQVIFTTAYDEFAIRAFQVNASDYLLKPIDIDDLLRAVSKIKPGSKEKTADERMAHLLVNNEQGKFEKIALPSAEGLHFIDLSEVVRLESDANYTSFHLHSSERITVARTLKNFENLLPEADFFRSHQSHIVNLRHVKRIERKDGGYLLMADHAQVPIARSKKEELMQIVRGRFLQ